MNVSSPIAFLTVAWAALLLFSGPAAAIEAPPPVPPAPMHTVSRLDPGALEQALRSQNPDAAKSELARGNCVPSDEAAEVVRQAWVARNSTGASRSMRDPVVRTLMAKCLAEYKPGFTALEPADMPVLAQLRLALGGKDPEQVQAAAFGLTQTATAEDVQAMLNAAARLPALQPLIAGALGQVCRVDAIAAAATIKSIATEERQRAEIENVEAHTAKMRRIYCGYDANIVPNGVSQADMADFFDPGDSDSGGSLGDIKSLSSSTNVEGARKALSKLRCFGGDQDTLKLVNQVWELRNSGGPNLATHDFGVQVLMAKCLVEITSRASQDKIPAAAKEQLRAAVKGSNDFDFIVAVEGLARIATAADIRLIEASAKGRNAVISDMTVQVLTRSCARGGQEAVAEIRKNTTRPKAARDMDYSIGVTKRVRDYVCGMH